ncbi:hypothetical protein BTM25_17310 [Actinomadura rubteroloni]|uniref:Uncharacterized protein n=1 Tax=Actinomadura rubteroloni TaxID=1926885 RepID=A0A2P4UQI7_9ACTN|nr:hypothetical protein [Actinomadura rubteroloni]POM27318.1 hypothetical protein BTM25_17310 [Actinomadura rubteroloni]
MELLLDDRPLTPRKATDLGLVHRLVLLCELDVRPLEAAERLASRPPRVIRELKRVA